MTTQPTSIRRRHVLIAGAVSAAAPALAFADGNGVRPLIDGPIVISGRVVDSAGRPLAGAPVSIDAVHATTDGDGRFVLSADAARARSIQVRVSDAKRTLPGDAFRRDESGTWRTTMGVALA